MHERALKMLGLMRRANAIQIGEEKTGNICRSGKAEVVILAQDASGNAQHRAEGFTSSRGVLLVTLPFTKEEIILSTGVPGCSMAAITDLGFADALMRILAEMQPEEYSGVFDAVHTRLKSAKAGAAKGKTAGKRKMKPKED